jgi:hypothetical protein
MGPQAEAGAALDQGHVAPLVVAASLNRHLAVDALLARGAALQPLAPHERARAAAGTGVTTALHAAAAWQVRACLGLGLGLGLPEVGVRVGLGLGLGFPNPGRRLRDPFRNL